MMKGYLELEEDALQGIAYAIGEAHIAGVRVACSSNSTDCCTGVSNVLVTFSRDSASHAQHTACTFKDHMADKRANHRRCRS